MFLDTCQFVFILNFCTERQVTSSFVYLGWCGDAVWLERSTWSSTRMDCVCFAQKSRWSNVFVLIYFFSSQLTKSILIFLFYFKNSLRDWLKSILNRIPTSGSGANAGRSICILFIKEYVFIFITLFFPAQDLLMYDFMQPS